MSDHTQRHAFCKVTYWKDHTASSTMEDWTVCKVSPLGMYAYGEQEFANTTQDLAKREALIAFLEKAYEMGCSDAKREIRTVLGVKEPRA